MSKQYDILIVDDEQVVIDAVDKICSAEKLKVDTALNIDAVMNKLDQNSYRLIICDIMLPESDGFQILEEISNKKITTPVIMTTGYSTVENAVKSLNSGAIDFIAKPFNDDELVSCVYRALKYEEIKKTLMESGENNTKQSIIFISCPIEYYRLGYISWILLEHTGSALIGVVDLFIKTIEVINNVDIFNLENETIQGNPCARIKTRDNLIHNVLAPVSGRIIERNEALLSEPSLLEKDPYFNGWLYRIIPSAIEYELKHLTSCKSDHF